MPGNGNSRSWATKRRTEFAITDGGFDVDASGSRGSKGGGDLTSGFEKNLMQSRIANRKK